MTKKKIITFISVFQRIMRKDFEHGRSLFIPNHSLREKTKKPQYKRLSKSTVSTIKGLAHLRSIASKISFRVVFTVTYNAVIKMDKQSYLQPRVLGLLSIRLLILNI